MVRSQTDLYLPCPGPDLVFKRYYNSILTDTNGILGPGWSHTYAWSVSTTTDVFHTAFLQGIVAPLIGQT